MNKKISTPLAIGTVVVLAGVVAGAVLLYPNIFCKPLPVSTLEPTSTSDETAVWKTYRNEDMGFDSKK